jgi:hypothetical protein
VGRAQLAIIAVVVALAAFGGGLVLFDDDRDPVAGTTTTTQPITSTITAPPATTPTGEMPTTLVAVTDDGRVVVVDVRSGKEVRELAALADPGAERDDDEEGPGPNVIDSVALSPDGQTVFWSECCEPAAGVLHRVPITGGESEDVGSGYAPAFGQDPSFVAVVDPLGVEVRDLVGDRGRRLVDELHGGSYQSVSLSLSGQLVAADFVTDGDKGQHGVAIATVAQLPGSEQDDPPATEPKVYLPVEGGGVWFPVFRADGKLVVAEQCCGLEPKGRARGLVVNPATLEVVATFNYPSPIVDQDYDGGGRWLLTTHADGSLLWQGNGKHGNLGRGYRAAAW